MFTRILGMFFFALTLASGTAWADSIEFSLRDLDNKSVSNTDVDGKVVVFSFWATWCGPCKEEMPHLQRMQDTYKDQGLVVLSVNTDDARTLSQVKPYIRKQGYTFTVLKDTNSKLLASQNPGKTLPFTVVLNREGEVHQRIAGYNPGDEEHLEAMVKELLGGKPAEHGKTTAE